MGLFKQKMNWNNYNSELANRGSLTVYLGDDLASKWAECRECGPADRGRPFVYPDQVIVLGLVLQQVYRLPLRQTVGLMHSVLSLVGVSLPVPDPSTLCRRRRHLILPHWPSAGSCIVIDSTGLQIRGPNTWLTSVHGLKRRTYRKIHLGVDPASSLIVAGMVTPCQTHDSEAFEPLLATADLSANREVIGDGAYDRRSCYAAARRCKLRLITPPRSGAVLRHDPSSLERNRAIKGVRWLGKANWKRVHHYGRRSLAEAAMHRLKAAFGPSLRSRLWPNQRHEALLRTHVLNSWLTPKRLSCI
jgi:IS5 family transposase